MSPTDDYTLLTIFNTTHDVSCVATSYFLCYPKTNYTTQYTQGNAKCLAVFQQKCRQILLFLPLLLSRYRGTPYLWHKIEKSVYFCSLSYRSVHNLFLQHLMVQKYQNKVYSIFKIPHIIISKKSEHFN